MSINEIFDEASIKQIIQNRKKIKSIISEVSKELRNMRVIKKIKKLKYDKKISAASEKHSYQHMGGTNLYIQLITVTQHEIINNKSMITQRKKFNLFELDSHQLYLRGGWISSKELINEAYQNCINDEIILVDDTLILSRRRMPLSNDIELNHFFNNNLMQLEKIWGQINQEKKPYLIGISESTSSKITNAILNESAHLHFEKFGSEIINYVNSFKQEYPWLAEGLLLEWLLRPGERAISYCLNEKNIEGKPTNLLKNGVITTYVKSGGNHLFRIETPKIYINSLEELEKIISIVYSHCLGRTAKIPKPLMESRSLLKTVNLSKTVKGFSNVINSLER